MILTDLRDKLIELKPDKVFYGMINQDLEEWDYIVFYRTNTTDNRTSFVREFQVAVVEENYIAEDYEEIVINKVTEMPGVRVVGDVEFEYTRKPNTDTVIEVMLINFAYSSKKGGKCGS